MTKSSRSSFAELRLRKLSEPYQKIPDSRRLFRQLESVQSEAYRHLAAANVINLDSYKNGQIFLGDQEISIALTREIQSANEKESAAVKFILEQLAIIPLYGPDGLKARTGLMEFRYDPS